MQHCLLMVEVCCTPYNLLCSISIADISEAPDEMPSNVLVIVGAAVTVVLVGILAIILAVLTCTVIHKKRQMKVPELDVQGQARKCDEGYQSENFTLEKYV